ncbi:hypothetical protein ISCGN_031419 [Ixodes scapularis]
MRCGRFSDKQPQAFSSLATVAAALQLLRRRGSCSSLPSFVSASRPFFAVSPRLTSYLLRCHRLERAFSPFLFLQSPTRVPCPTTMSFNEGDKKGRVVPRRRGASSSFY